MYLYRWCNVNTQSKRLLVCWPLKPHKDTNVKIFLLDYEEHVICGSTDLVVFDFKLIPIRVQR